MLLPVCPTDSKDCLLLTRYLLVISLLPSPFSVVYVLPLVLTSFVLTVSGAFFTLDRSHSFRPAGIDDHPDHIVPHPLWKFDGGIGGLAIGFCFGGQLMILLSIGYSRRAHTVNMSLIFSSCRDAHHSRGLESHNHPSSVPSRILRSVARFVRRVRFNRVPVESRCRCFIWNHGRVRLTLVLLTRETCG